MSGRETKSSRMRRLASNRRLLRELKDRPCTDCGIQYPPYVMQFDHPEGSEKRANVAAMVTWSQASLLAEAAKCDIICANCHAERTHQRRG